MHESSGRPSSSIRPPHAPQLSAGLNFFRLTLLRWHMVFSLASLRRSGGCRIDWSMRQWVAGVRRDAPRAARSIRRAERTA